MRIELEDPNKKQTESTAFTPPKDEKRTFKSEIAKMKELGFKAGFTYFKDYYGKIVIAIIVAIAVVISMGHSIILNKRPYVIEVQIYNNVVDDSSLLETYGEAFAEHMGLNLKDYQILISAEDYFNPTQMSEEMQATIMKFSAMTAAGELDIIGGDRTFMDYYGTAPEGEGYFMDLSEILPEDLFNSLNALNLFYYGNVTDEDGNVLRSVPIGINIEGSRLTNDGGLLVTPSYIGIIINTDRLDTCIEFIRWNFYLDE